MKETVEGGYKMDYGERGGGGGGGGCFLLVNERGEDGL